MENAEINGLENEEIKEVKQKKKRKVPIIFIVFAVLIALFIIVTVVGVIYIKNTFNYKYNDLDKTPEELGVEQVINDEIVNIALFGVDTRDENSFEGRSDSIMILSINKTDKKIKLISVLRDSLVPMLHSGEVVYNKINAAYASGGPEEAIKTLNNVFALDITEYATVNFSGMANIIDVMGGVNVNLTAGEIKHINYTAKEVAEKYGGVKEDYIITEPGLHLLNGVQAVAYSRIRYTANAQGTSDDYGRTDRQRYVLQQMFNKALTIGKDQFPNLIKTMSPYCETSLSHYEILKLAVSILLGSPSFEESRVPFREYIMTSPSDFSKNSVVYYDLEFAANIIHAFIYDDIKPETYIETNDISQKDWYTEGYKRPVISKNEQ